MNDEHQPQDELYIHNSFTPTLGWIVHSQFFHINLRLNCTFTILSHQLQDEHQPQDQSHIKILLHQFQDLSRTLNIILYQLQDQSHIHNSFYTNLRMNHTFNFFLQQPQDESRTQNSFTSTLLHQSERRVIKSQAKCWTTAPDMRRSTANSCVKNSQQQAKSQC